MIIELRSQHDRHVVTLMSVLLSPTGMSIILIDNEGTTLYIPRQCWQDVSQAVEGMLKEHGNRHFQGILHNEFTEHLQ